MEPLEPDDPERVGRYRLLRRLGEGGMGVVYLAGSWTGRRVAVKVIHDHLLTDAESRARFAREIKAAQTVSGPFTARVLHAEPAAEPPWLATEFLPGVTLQTAIETVEDGLGAATVRALALGVVDALATIHRRGVVHRDLTPRNIMLTEGGPKVIDFGISRIAGYLPVTRPDRRFGSPAYMSPENLRGAAARPADDVFSLGAVLAFAATGRPPPAAGATASAWRLDALADPELSQVVADCLDPSPQRRPGAEELLERLGRDGVALHGTDWLPEPIAALIAFRTGQSRELDPEPAHREAAPGPDPDDTAATTTATGTDATQPEADDPLPVRDRGPTRRRVLTAAALFAATGAGSAAWLLRPADGSSGGADPAPTPAASPEPASAKQRWQTRIGNSSPDLDLAGGMLLATTPDELIGVDPANGEIAWRHKADSTRISGDHGFYMDNDDYPDTTIRAVHPASGKTAWSHRTDSLLWSAFSAAKRTYVVTDRILALDAGTGDSRWSADVPPDKDFGLSVRADDELVVARGKRIVALDRADGGSRWDYAPEEKINPLILPVLGGGLVFVFDERFGLHALDARDGKPVWHKEVRPVVSGPRYRDGSLYVPNVDGDIFALDAETGKQLWAVRLGGGEGGSYGYSNVINADDDTLYVGGTDGRVYGLDTGDGGVVWTHTADATHTSAPAAADGSVFIGLADGNLRALEQPR